MASAYKPEEARVPPALPLPTPPVTKASCLFNLSFKIALCQLSVTPDKERNISHARKAIEDAAAKGAQLVVLPEIWNGPYSNDSFPVYAEDIDAGGDASPSTAMLSEVAQRLKITIVGGSIAERSGDRLYNTSCVFDTDGKLLAKHRKIHLFDIDIPGKITFIESKTLTAGQTPTIVDTEVGRIGIGICYDIRFQELAMIYAARVSAPNPLRFDKFKFMKSASGFFFAVQLIWFFEGLLLLEIPNDNSNKLLKSGAHLICYPGAFNMTTGPLHWELLQRARATDNQLYVATCSPARDAGAGYVAWGHSTLVGPFGEVMATTEHEESIIIAEIDYSIIELRRTNLPLLKQRRGDLYRLPSPPASASVAAQSQIRSANFLSVMAAAYKPEEARVPPALPLPAPPVTKASCLFNLCVCLFKIALCQLSVTPDKERNIAHSRKAIEDAAAKGAQLVLLPEIWNGPYSNDSFPVYAEDIDAGGDASPSTAMLSEVAQRLKITIVGGSIVERSGDRLYNTSCVFGTNGKLLAKHRKLFDINVPGKITFTESKTLTAGQTPTVVDTEVGRIGIGICYDINFEEIAMIYGARGAHLICYPGAFNMTTGPLHWELLQRARATDNQLYVATCSPARDAGAGYVAWGHSTLVGPFGEVLATTEHEEAIIIAEIDYSIIELRRTNLPLLKQRRGDLYRLVDVERLNSQ
ncbi:hypothetical protein DVH24_012688 [Malus domestica]|uniref:CN hydrolase domain-containing protein n=1 Tax=Malus domestica TaxID=3750 RepID=A0A498HRU5_MALDO|nr:hypothetical protein DVH24_012688 [Malus domestica]